MELVENYEIPIPPPAKLVDLTIRLTRDEVKYIQQFCHSEDDKPFSYQHFWGSSTACKLINEIKKVNLG